MNRNETFMLLNQTIHPFVLQLAAGDKIVAFCGTLPATWMIPEDEDQGEEQQQETRMSYLQYSKLR